LCSQKVNFESFCECIFHNISLRSNINNIRAKITAAVRSPERTGGTWSCHTFQCEVFAGKSYLLMPIYRKLLRKKRCQVSQCHPVI